MKIVLTGAPGSGKSTLISALAARGEQTVKESAIEVINHLISEMGLSEQDDWRRSDPYSFQHRVYLHQTELESQLNPARRSFLDRGALDGMAYLRMQRVPIPPVFKAEVTAHHYDLIFLVEPLEVVDLRVGSGRNDTAEEAKKLVGLLRDEYEAQGYKVLSIPPLPIDERVDYLLKLVDEHA